MHVVIFITIMQRKIWINSMLRKKLWNAFVICILTTDTSKSLDIQIGLYLKTVLSDLNKLLGVRN